MHVAVIGTGYVGLVAGVCFADAGHDVACVDINEEQIASLQAGEVPIYEEGLASVLRRVQREERIRFTTAHADAVPTAEVVVVAVGTPEGEGGQPDLRALDRCIADVIPHLRDHTVIVLKSTVPVGTAKRVRAKLASFPELDADVVSNPEFLREGAALDDFLRPDRIVVGTDSDKAFDTMQALYRPFTQNGGPILRMSNPSAELTKYASNAMLATRISYMNEIARLCDAVGADVEDVKGGVGSDSRIGDAFLNAGCGYGGSCFPKDTQGLIHVGRAFGVSMRIATAAEAVNDEQKEILAGRVKARLGDDLAGKRIAIFGLSFKPQTDDVREAPAEIIIGQLLSSGAEVVGTDPEGMENFKQYFGDKMGYTGDPYVAAKDADAIVLCTEWNEYRNLDFERLGEIMRARNVFDGRNVIRRDSAESAGFYYEGMGRGREGL